MSRHCPMVVTTMLQVDLQSLCRRSDTLSAGSMDNAQASQAVPFGHRRPCPCLQLPSLQHCPSCMSLPGRVATQPDPASGPDQIESRALLVVKLFEATAACLSLWYASTHWRLAFFMHPDRRVASPGETEAARSRPFILVAMAEGVRLGRAGGQVDLRPEAGP